jgi:hypothetical protein
MNDDIPALNGGSNIRPMDPSTGEGTGGGGRYFETARRKKECRARAAPRRHVRLNLSEEAQAWLSESRKKGDQDDPRNTKPEEGNS